MSLLSFLGLGEGKRKNALQERRTIYCDSDSQNALTIFTAAGYPLVEDPDEAELLWIREGYKKYKDKLKPFQLLNHFPKERELTDKGHLAENLQRFDQVQTKYDFGVKDLIQETYCLYKPEEREKFFAQMPPEDSKENLWILKPRESSQGEGIFILWEFQELRKVFENPRRYLYDPVANPCIIQRYIQNPLLLDGRKSEIRIYWLIASLNPLLVLIYKEGTVRLNSRPFSLEDFDNTLIHVTNVYQQETHPEYDPSIVLKWSWAYWEKYLIEERKLAPENYVEAQLKPQLKRMFSFVIDAARDALAQHPETGLFFGLLGADIIFDDKLHPWLTEVQRGPGLSFDDPIKKEVIPPMLSEAAAIMLEVRRRKRDGLSLEKLDAVKNFEWVVHET